MVEETLTVGDTEVVVRETEDGFEVEEAETKSEFEQWAERQPAICGYRQSGHEAKFGFDKSAATTMEGQIKMDDVPGSVRSIEKDNTFGGDVYVRVDL